MEHILLDKNGLTEAAFLASYRSDKYPKPSLTADHVIFSRREEKIFVLLVRRGGHPFLGKWAIPGGFAKSSETLEETAHRELLEETGIDQKGQKLIGVYSQPGRDPRGWVVSVAYATLIEKDCFSLQAGDDASETAWFEIIQKDGGLALQNGDFFVSFNQPANPFLAFDHEQILKDAYTSFFGKKEAVIDA